jgi:hypothetical protein
MRGFFVRKKPCQIETEDRRLRMMGNQPQHRLQALLPHPAMPVIVQQTNAGTGVFRVKTELGFDHCRSLGRHGHPARIPGDARVSPMSEVLQLNAFDLIVRLT